MSENPDNDYQYTILHQCRSKAELHYLELKELWGHDVLAEMFESGEYIYFNKWIGAIKFRPPVYKEE
jgi:hypothetical protein